MMASSRDRSFISKLTSVVGLDNIHFNQGREAEKPQATSDIVTMGTRNIYKAVIPRFLYKPPFGYPRFVDIPELRRLAQTPYVEMAIATITDEIAAVPWDIVPEDETLEDEPGSLEDKCQKVKAFFENPNCNKENFATQLRKVIRDILEVDSGVWVKVFNNANQMSQLFVRDGGTFIMNPDIFGTFDGKEEFIFPDYQNTLMNPTFYTRNGDPKNKGAWDTLNQVAEKAAYFQYGWITGARPMPFGTREIVYMMRNPRADSIYGQSPIEICLDMIQMLVYGIDHNLEYFTDNNVPKGVFKMIGAGDEEIKSFGEKWREANRMKDEVGNYRKRFHNMPVINVDGSFEKIQFSNAELELITQQEWFTKLLWSCFGVTPSELGFTEDSNRANEIVQSRVFRRKAIRPLLSLIEYHINIEIIPEFEKAVVINYGMEGKEEVVTGITGVKFKFDMHDITEEIQKNELYKLQIDNKIRTPNEIREEMNLPPIEGGDGFPQFNPFGMGKPGQLGEGQPERDQEGSKIPGENEFEREDPKEGDEKDGLKEFDDVLERVSMKAYRTDSPLVLKPFEEPAKQLIRIFNSAFLTQKKKIYEMIDVYAGGKRPEAKDLNKQVIRMIKDILSTALVEDAVRKAVEASYLKAIEQAGEEHGRDFLPVKNNLNFIIEHALDNVKDMSEAIKSKLRAELERGIMAGEGITKLKTRITDVFDMAGTRAETIARTETSRAENVGLIDAYSQAGVKGKKEWVAHLDSKTCPDCKRLNGTTAGLEAQFKSMDAVINPPAHPNCRCRTIFRPEE